MPSLYCFQIDKKKCHYVHAYHHILKHAFYVGLHSHLTLRVDCYL